MQSFEDTDGDGISNVPQYYAEKQGRKVVEDSKNILELIKNPNKYALLIVGAVVLVIILLILLILGIKKAVQKVRKK